MLIYNKISQSFAIANLAKICLKKHFLELSSKFACPLHFKTKVIIVVQINRSK